eukprot:c13820_g1_i1 orf=91-279(+)
MKLKARWMGNTPRTGLSIGSSQIWWLPWHGQAIAERFPRALMWWMRGVCQWRQLWSCDKWDW